MVINAQSQTRSGRQASKWLGVSYNCYKKWAKYYNIFEQHLNQEGKGVKKGWASYKIPLNEILSGKRKCNYSLHTLKKRLVEEGYWQEECHTCGFNEGRVTDERIPLSIDFQDGNSDNKSLKNMRLLCPNCYFVWNGFFHSSKTFCK
jgi:hypothetical protein